MKLIPKEAMPAVCQEQGCSYAIVDGPRYRQPDCAVYLQHTGPDRVVLFPILWAQINDPTADIWGSIMPLIEKLHGGK
jgi:hypothetical protein